MAATGAEAAVAMAAAGRVQLARMGVASWVAVAAATAVAVVVRAELLEGRDSQVSGEEEEVAVRVKEAVARATAAVAKVAAARAQGEELRVRERGAGAKAVVLLVVDALEVVVEGEVGVSMAAGVVWKGGDE